MAKLYQVNSSCLEQETPKRVKGSLWEGRKQLQKYMYNGLISDIHKELLKLNRNKVLKAKSEQVVWIDILQEEDPSCYHTSGILLMTLNMGEKKTKTAIP